MEYVALTVDATKKLIRIGSPDNMPDIVIASFVRSGFSIIVMSIEEFREKKFTLYEKVDILITPKSTEHG